MTRNNDKMAQLGAAIGPPTQAQRYQLQGLAQAQRTVVQGSNELWADQIHTFAKEGKCSPIAKGDRELWLRSLFRAIRILQAGDAKQQKQARDLSRHLENAWGIKQACVAIGGNDLEAVRRLREAWGDAQLPPVDAMVAGSTPNEDGWAADELLIQAAVRRLG